MSSFRYIGLAVLVAKAHKAVEQAVTESCEHLVGMSQEVTPVDTGTLRASIHVDKIESSGNTVTGTVSTGGEADEYAIYQHEGTSRGVPATKFLEGPLQQNTPLYLEAMKRAAAGEF